MATGCDKTVGVSMVVISGLIFCYYTFWVIVLPFVEADHMIHKYFLPQVYAITIPIIVGVIGILGLAVMAYLVVMFGVIESPDIGTFIGIVIIQSKFKQKQS